MWLEKLFQRKEFSFLSGTLKQDCMAFTVLITSLLARLARTEFYTNSKLLTSFSQEWDISKSNQVFQ